VSKIKTSADTIKKEINNEEVSSAREQQLATDLQLIGLLRENPDFLIRHPELLAVLEVKHQSGNAVSLIERQVEVLRQQKQTEEERLLELMDVARDNERLAAIRHRLAIDLLSTHDINDVMAIVLDTFKDELAADYAAIKLFSTDEKEIQQSSGLFVNAEDDALNAFKTMLQHKNTVCGKSTQEQKDYLFDDNAKNVKSVAIIPLVAGANLGLIGLGADNAERFNASMGTEFLAQIGELISASLAIHLES
jgi:uncharacterized protein YigA (DUF484 family)